MGRVRHVEVAVWQYASCPVHGAITHGCGQLPCGLDASTATHTQPLADSARQSASVVHGALGEGVGAIEVGLGASAPSEPLQAPRRTATRATQRIDTGFMTSR